MSYSFDYVHITATDVEATLTWFERMFDARRVWKGDFGGTPITRVVFDGVAVNVFHKPPVGTPEPDTAVIHHFALQPSDFDATIAELKRRGADFHSNPTSVGEYLRVAFINGPDNLRIEIITGDLPDGNGLG